MTSHAQAVRATAEIAGRTVSRVGFGAARLTAGDGWGAPADPERSRDLLLAAVEAGYNYIDTADALGPGVSEQLIGEALGAREDVFVATKIGMLRPLADRWGVLGHPDYLRQQIHLSRARLRRERLDLLYLHRIDPAYPLADQLGVLQEARERGDIGAIGVSEPTASQFHEVLALEPDLAAVQSLYNPVARGNAQLAELAAERGIAFVAYWPLLGRGLRQPVKDALLAELRTIGAPLRLTPSQLLLAWIFSTQPRSIAVVGSRTIDHLVQNRLAADQELTACTLEDIAAAVQRTVGDTPFDPRFPEEAA